MPSQSTPSKSSARMCGMVIDRPPRLPHPSRGFYEGRSLDPMQDIADDGPPRLLRHGVLAQNPIVVERSNGFVFLLEFDPRIDKTDQLRVTPGHGIGQWNRQDIRLGNGNAIRGVEQGPGRT